MDWKEAEEHLNEMKSMYEEIGQVGAFGLIFINALMVRFNNGERTQELYDEIMSME